jgi:hypothetical protein
MFVEALLLPYSTPLLQDQVLHESMPSKCIHLPYLLEKGKVTFFAGPFTISDRCQDLWKQ